MSKFFDGLVRVTLWGQEFGEALWKRVFSLYTLLSGLALISVMVYYFKNDNPTAGILFLVFLHLHIIIIQLWKQFKILNKGKMEHNAAEEYAEYMEGKEDGG